MSETLHPAVEALANKARSLHPNALAVLAYGSALRESSPEDTLIDLYVLTADFSGVSTNIISQFGCRLVPPNVRYLETQVDARVFRAKYAVLPLAQFENRMGRHVGNPYFWARFCQPVRLVWSKDQDIEARVTRARETAAATAYAHAKALAPQETPLMQWARLFDETYRTELRPEGVSRSREIVTAKAKHYEALAARHANVAPLAANWPLRRLHGKLLTVLRLAKASFTFQGGADYLAWKIKRHSGVDVHLTDFQRRHPLLASVVLLPKLLRKGAIK